jgi:hypothetical protein
MPKDTTKSVFLENILEKSSWENLSCVFKYSTKRGAKRPGDLCQAPATFSRILLKNVPACHIHRHVFHTEYEALPKGALPKGEAHHSLMVEEPIDMPGLIEENQHPIPATFAPTAPAPAPAPAPSSAFAPTTAEGDSQETSENPSQDTDNALVAISPPTSYREQSVNLWKSVSFKSSKKFAYTSDSFLLKERAFLRDLSFHYRLEVPKRDFVCCECEQEKVETMLMTGGFQFICGHCFYKWHIETGGFYPVKIARRIPGFDARPED